MQNRKLTNDSYLFPPLWQGTRESLKEDRQSRRGRLLRTYWFTNVVRYGIFMMRFELMIPSDSGTKSDRWFSNIPMLEERERDSREGEGGGEEGNFSPLRVFSVSREVIRASSSRKDLDIRVKNRSEEREDGVEIRFVSSRWPRWFCRGTGFEEEEVKRCD